MEVGPRSARDWPALRPRYVRRLIVHKLRASHRRACQGLASNQPSLFRRCLAPQPPPVVHSWRALLRSPQSISRVVTVPLASGRLACLHSLLTDLGPLAVSLSCMVCVLEFLQCRRRFLPRFVCLSVSRD